MRSLQRWLLASMHKFPRRLSMRLPLEHAAGLEWEKMRRRILLRSRERGLCAYLRGEGRQILSMQMQCRIQNRARQEELHWWAFLWDSYKSKTWRAGTRPLIHKPICHFHSNTRFMQITLSPSKTTAFSDRPLFGEQRGLSTSLRVREWQGALSMLSGLQIVIWQENLCGCGWMRAE